MFYVAIILAGVGCGMLAPDVERAFGYACVLFAIMITLTTRRT